MASGMYSKGVAAIMGGDIDLVNHTISAILISTAGSYTPDLSADTFQTDIPEASQVAEVILTSKTIDGRTFRADAVVFPSVAAGADLVAVALIKDSGTQASSNLICYLDNAVEFPITPDGTNVTIVWDTGAEGIFTL